MTKNMRGSQGAVPQGVAGHKSVAVVLVATVEQANTNLCRLQHDVRAYNIVLCEGEAVAERVVDVGLGGKVKHSVYILRLHYICHEVYAGNIALDKLEVGVAAVNSNFVSVVRAQQRDGEIGVAIERTAAQETWRIAKGGAWD